MDFRQSVIEAFRKILSDKIAELLQQSGDLQESVAAETKSSVGDKYETGRAMLHLEMEKLNYHLRESRDQLTLLQTYEKPVATDQIAPGNIVKTDKGNFFISGAFGKTTIEGESVMAVSPVSPIGKALIGNVTNMAIHLQKTSYFIISIH